ncbi:MAG: SDR family NAD(P)-dependent oxidoreductase, partial [Myxococcota bacterium]
MKLQKMSEWRRRYGPWAVVTGASRGIGKELARELATRGFSLVLAAQDGDRLGEMEAALLEDWHLETVLVAADLSTHEGNEALFAACLDRDVGLFVGNAGFGSSGDFADRDIENEMAMIDLNVRFLAQQAHFFANQFRRRGCGGLILLSSIVSWQGVPRAANYAATKAYVQSLAEGLSRELHKDRVDVLSSAPAQVDTDFLETAGMKGSGVSARVVARNTLNALGRRTTVYPH